MALEQLLNRLKMEHLQASLDRFLTHLRSSIFSQRRCFLAWEVFFNGYLHGLMLRVLSLPKGDKIVFTN